MIRNPRIRIRNTKFKYRYLNINGNGIFIDLFTLENYIILRFHHRRWLGSHILIRYILYFLDELQKLAEWHPNTMTYIKNYIILRFHPCRWLGSHILIRYILYFLDELQKLAKWHPNIVSKFFSFCLAHLRSWRH